MSGLIGMKKSTINKLLKPLRDFLLIFYDDLEFHAMSLPRLGAGILTIILIITWYQLLFCDREFEHFQALASLCGGVWAAYSFKKWTLRREDIECDDRNDIKQD